MEDVGAEEEMDRKGALKGGACGTRTLAWAARGFRPTRRRVAQTQWPSGPSSHGLRGPMAQAGLNLRYDID